MHSNYSGTPTTLVSYSNSIAEQTGFGNAPSSYSIMSTHVTTVFNGPSKSYAVSDKQPGAFSSGLSQVYEGAGMGNVYLTGNQSEMQMAYQSGEMYLNNQQGTGLSYNGIPAVSSGAYQSPANLYRADQMTRNANDFPPGISESFPRNAPVIGITQQQAAMSGKPIDGSSKLPVKDVTNSAISNRCDSTAKPGSSLTSSAVSFSNSIVSCVASSSLKTSAVAAAKSAIASELYRCS